MLLSSKVTKSVKLLPVEFKAVMFKWVILQYNLSFLPLSN